MKKVFAYSSTTLLLAFLTGCTGLSLAETEEPMTGPTIEIYKHSVWSDIEPKGVDCDGLRMNLAPEDSLEFKDLKVTVTAMSSAEENGTDADQVYITLEAGGESDTRTVDEGVAFTWNGYYVAIVAIYAKKGDLGYGSTVFEVATAASLPPDVATSETANGPEHRLRVKHEIDKLTLHHSATPHTAEDDLGKKLKNMQVWGENDRQWWDVPYHFIIDIDGSILEARDYHYMGDTNTRYDPRGHFLINCYGNYMEAEPNERQLESIAKLMAWAAMEFDIEPIEIYGHRDLAQTSCPGDNLQKYIEDGTFKSKIEAIMAEGKPQLVWLDSKTPAAE